MTLQKAIFLDRDGVLNIDTGYPFKLQELQLIDGISAPLTAMMEMGYALYIVTNQSAIARGFCSESDVVRFNAALCSKLEALSVTISGVSFCPHFVGGSISKFSVSCNCRKPRPGMFLELSAKYYLDLSQSIMIGDSISDVEAGKAAGLKQSFRVQSNKSGELTRVLNLVRGLN